MRSTRPPRLAHWLLANFGFSQNNSAVIGDLDERYRQGRSPLWYWKQAITAIATGIFAVTRSNRLLALRALGIGWGIAFLFAPMLPRLIHLLRGYPRGSGILPSSWTTVEWLYVRGWIVPEGTAYVFAAICCIMTFFIGWIVGRLNRPDHLKAVAIFLASWFVSFVLAAVIAMAKILQDWSATSWRYDNPYFFIFGVVMNLLAMLSMAAGGMQSGTRTA